MIWLDLFVIVAVAILIAIQVRPVKGDRGEDVE